MNWFNVAIASAAFVAAATFIVGGGLMLYLRGVREGYGYAREPGAAEFRTAGRFLRRRYAERWPELNPPTDKAREIKIGELRLLVRWCDEQLADDAAPDEFKAGVRVRREGTVLEIEELLTGLK